MVFISTAFYHFVKIPRYILIEAMTNSIIELLGRYLYLVKTLNHARSVFSPCKNRSCASWVFLIVLSNFFFLQKHKKRSCTDILNDRMTMQDLNGTFNQNILTTGEGEE
jgi:hypothetical protein